MIDQRLVERALCVLSVAVLGGSMTMGLWQAMLVSQGVTKAIVESLSVVALVLCLMVRPESRKPLIYMAPIVAVVVIGMLVAIRGVDGFLGGVLFARDLLKPVLLLVVAYSFTQGRSLRILAIAFAVLTVLQIPVAMIKLNAIGIDEKHWVGTMHQSAGQLGILLPLLTISPLVILGLLAGSWVTWLLCFYSFFAIVNEKRLAMFAMPCLAFAVWLLAVVRQFCRGHKKPPIFPRNRLSTFIAIAVISAGTFYFSVFSIPSLNARGVYAGGTIDLQYLKDYLWEYLTRGYVSWLNNPSERLATDTGIQMGRLQLIKQAAHHVYEQPLPVALFGFGGSHTSPSHLLGPDRNDILFERHGLRGATPLAVRILIDAGYAGLIALLAWFLWIGLILIHRTADENPKIATLGIVGLGWHAVMAFDTFLYSTAMWTYGILSAPYFLLLGVLLMQPKKLTRMLEEALKLE